MASQRFSSKDASGDLLSGLVQSLMQEEALPDLKAKSPAELAQHWRTSPEAVINLAVRSELQRLAREVQEKEKLPRPPEARLALVVDQMEEIFTLEKVTPAQRQEFVHALVALARSGCVWVLATMRSDFYTRAQELAELLELKKGEGQYDLLPSTPAEIGQMIRQPAAMAGLEFEEQGEPPGRLDDVLRDAASRNPQALPLLEFALEELYTRCSRDEQRPQVLTFAAYEAMGGLSGAIARRAEDVFESLTETERDTALDLVLANLVTLGLGENESLTAKRIPLEKIASTPASRELVDAFVATRLMVADRSNDGGTVVGLAHEALLEHWDKAREWVEQNRDFLRIRTRIATAAALWHGQEELPGLLLPPGKPLAEAEKLLLAQRGKLGDDEIRYIETSSREAKSIKRRRALWRVTWIGALISLVFIGLWYWDAYYRDHHEYYTNMTKRWGAPEGIGSISAGQASQRNISHQFLRRGRKGLVTEVRMVNGSGELEKSHGRSTYLDAHRGDVITQLAQKECRYVFERDAKGRVIKEKAFNRLGNLIFEFAYLSDDNATASYLEPGRGVQARSGAGAAYVVFSRPATGPSKGLEEEIRFLDVAWKPKPNRDEIYGVHKTFNAQGLPETITYLGSDGKPALHKEGYAKATLEYDKLGNIIEAAVYNINDHPTLRKDGFFKWIKKFDDWGNPIAEAYFGIDGQPTFNKDGFAKVTYNYDKQGNMIEMAFFDIVGHPTLSKYLGFAKITFKYDKKGNINESSGYDIDGQPTLNKNGVFKNTLKVDDWGNLIEEVFFDTNGQPTFSNFGYAKGTLQYDKQGNIVETAFFDTVGQLILNKDGFSKLTRKTDDRGNVVEEAYFGRDGQPTLNKDGFSKRTQRFDDLGNLIEVAYFGSDGRPTLSKDGYSKLTKKVDDRGNVVEEAYFGRDGRPTLSKYGYSKLTQKIDDRDKVIEQAYFGVDGQPALHKDGYSKVTQKSDGRGNLIELAYIGIDGQPILKDGFSKLTRKVDELDNVTEEAYFGIDGRPSLYKDGYSKLTQKVDDRGNLIEQAYFGVDGQPALHKDGYSKWTKKVDARGNDIEKAYFGLDDQPIINTEGFARQTWQYDRNGNVAKESFWNIDGSPARTKVIITEVLSGGQGEKICLKPGDRVIRYNAEPVINIGTFITSIPGTQKRTLTILRNGKEINFSVDPGLLQVNTANQGPEEPERVP